MCKPSSEIDNDQKDELMLTEIRDMLLEFLATCITGGVPLEIAEIRAPDILAKVKQHKTSQFRRALEQSRKGEPLDLSAEDFELFSAIQTDGTIKSQQEELDRPELREKILAIEKGETCDTLENRLCDARTPRPDACVQCKTNQLRALIPDIEQIECAFEDWDDTTLPHPASHCLKREGVDCANVPDDVEACPDFMSKQDWGIEEAKKQEKERIIKDIEEHSAVEQLPLRDGGVMIRTIPEDYWQSLKKEK